MTETRRGHGGLGGQMMMRKVLETKTRPRFFRVLGASFSSFSDSPFSFILCLIVGESQAASASTTVEAEPKSQGHNVAVASSTSFPLSFWAKQHFRRSKLCKMRSHKGQSSKSAIGICLKLPLLKQSCTMVANP